MTEECSMCSMHKAFHDVALAEKRLTEFQLAGTKLELKEAIAHVERLKAEVEHLRASSGKADNNTPKEGSDV
jgi:hypothetical protein